jgi:plasmid stability protein
MISLTVLDIMADVKQLLLRVPADLHRRLAARAAREGRSVNAVATELLDLTAEADQGDRRSRLRAAAAAAGFLRGVRSRDLPPGRRGQIVDSTRGLGPIADALIADERDRP